MYNFGKNNRESKDLMFAVISDFKVDIVHYHSRNIALLFSINIRLIVIQERIIRISINRV